MKNQTTNSIQTTNKKTSFTQLNHRNKVLSQYKDLFSSAVCFKLSQEQYLQKLDKIRLSNSYKRLTNYNKEYIRGYENCFSDSLYCSRYGNKALLTFCYDFNGIRYSIESEEYKKLSPAEVNEKHTFAGHCWKSDITKIWF